MNKRLVSIICAAALFTQTLPTNAIATTIEDAFIKKGLNSEVDKDKSDSNSEESSSKDENKGEATDLPFGGGAIGFVGYDMIIIREQSFRLLRDLR